MRITNAPKNADLSICVDFNEKYVRLKAFDSKGDLFNDRGLIVPVNNCSTRFTDTLIDAVHDHIAQLAHDAKQIVGLAVSCPGVIGAKGSDVTFS